MTNRVRAALNPRIVLLAAIFLPGSGQVLNGQPTRGLMFLFFMFLLGGYTLITAAPEVSIIGKLAGGLFIYAISIFDAYKYARISREVASYRRSSGQG